jgi:hypothetical protein
MSLDAIVAECGLQNAGLTKIGLEGCEADPTCKTAWDPKPLWGEVDTIAWVRGARD